MTTQVVQTGGSVRITADLGPVEGPAGKDGINGGIGSSAGFAALFAAAGGMAIGAGITRAKLSGYSTPGIGGADYIYDAAVNGAFVSANPRTAFLAADGRGFRLDPGQRLTPEMFGARGDFVRSKYSGTASQIAAAIAADVAAGLVTDNLAALQAALQFRPTPGISFSPTLWIGYGAYYYSGTLLVSGAFHIETSNPSSAANTGFAASAFYTPTNVMCIRGQSNVNLSGQSVGNTFSIIRNMHFEQVTRGNDLTAHGIATSCAMFLEHCSFDNIAGDGIHIEAYNIPGNPYAGEASCWRVVNCRVYTCGGNGLRVDGSDANAGTCEGFITDRCGGSGIYDSSYYGNYYESWELAGYGNGTPGQPLGVYHNGRNWQAIRNDGGSYEPGLPGVGEMVWYYRGPASGPTSVWPEWQSGASYRIMCPIYITGAGELVGHYVEGAGEYGYSHAPLSSVFGPNYGWTAYTPVLDANVTSRGIGQRRSTRGDMSDPAYPAIGLGEMTMIGTPALFASDTLRRRSSILRHYCADDRFDIDYYGGTANDGDLVLRTAYGDAMSWSQARTLRTYGRGAPYPGLTTLHDYALHDPTAFDAVNFGVVRGVRAAVPTTGIYGAGTLFENASLVPGNWHIAFVQPGNGGAIATGPWVAGYFDYGTVFTVTTGGTTTTWYISRIVDGNRQSIAQPSGSGPTFTDPTTLLQWTKATQPFVFTTKNL